jgi:hypothetical protein
LEFWSIFEFIEYSEKDNDIEGFLYILYIFDKSLALLPRIPRIRSYGIALAMKSD